MRIAIPHMGNVCIPFKAMFQTVGVDFVIPPPSSQRALSLGTKYSPEGLCIPFKLTLGNMIEAAELGADTILMAGGFGTCRFGYYARLQKQILQDLGYDIDMVEMDFSQRKALGFWKLGRRITHNAPLSKFVASLIIGLAKVNALDRVERLVQKVRPIEQARGTANIIFSQAIKAIDDAASPGEVKKAQKYYLDQLNRIPIDSKARPLKVGIIGEFYVILEPFANLNVESELGRLGVEVRRTIFLSRWTKFTLFLNAIGMDEKSRIHRAAYPYLKRDIGGDGWESVGEKVLHSSDYDGLVHISPFTCMPETIARNIMPTTRENIPVLTLLCDEQMSKPRILTRLEAFVDMLEQRRHAKENYKQLNAV